jgi:Bacterial PH domain
VAVALAVLALVALGLAVSREPGGTMVLWALVAFVLGALACGVGLWGLAYRQLAYTLTERALEIAWRGHTLVVPYVAVDGIYTGQRLVGSSTPNPPVWPGIYVGSGRAKGVGRLRFFTTSPDPSALTLITLEHSAVVVSARNPHEFRTALIERIQGAPSDPAASASVTRVPPRTPPWSAAFDVWLPGAVAVGLVLILGMLAAIGLGFEGLPLDIPMRFDASGDPTQIAPRVDLLRLPLIGLALLVGDAAVGVWLHPRERLLARLLWVCGAVLQAVLFVAVVRLVQ